MYNSNFSAKLEAFDAEHRNTSSSSMSGSSLPVIQIECAQNIIPEAISWLWNGWLARGKFHLLAGAAGCGKTTLALNFAAIISQGGNFPEANSSKPLNVLIWSGEDSAEDTLVPRIIAAGADLANVHIIRRVFQDNQPRGFDPSIDMPALILAAKNLGNIGMLIVDPIVNAVSGDSHKNGEVRRGLAPLVEFGQHLNCAILGITHISKGSKGRDPLERVTGSLAFGALARLVIIAAKVTEDEVTKRIFCRVKSNIGQDGDGFEYEVQQTELEDYKGIFTSFATIGNALFGPAHRLLAETEQAQEAQDCATFLLDILSQGRMPAKEVYQAGIENGFSNDQIRRAREKLKIKPHKDGFGKGAPFFWDLPPKPKTEDSS